MRDVLFGADMAYMVMPLLCGVEAPVSLLPGWLRTIGDGLPPTHGLIAIKAIPVQSLGDASGLIVTEAIIGTCYLAAGLRHDPPARASKFPGWDVRGGCSGSGG